MCSSDLYREAFGSHAYDAEGNYIGTYDYSEFTPETEAQAAWAEYAVPAPAVDEEVTADAGVAETIEVAETAELTE